MSTPPPTTAPAAHRAAADLLETLDLPERISTSIAGAHIDIQITRDAPAADRLRAVDTAHRTINAADRHTMVYAPNVESWGSVGTTGTWQGIPTSVWTALTRDEARAAGLATCAGCGHGDHGDDTTCLAAMIDPDGREGTCECGRTVDPPTVGEVWDGNPELADHAWDAAIDQARNADRESAL